MAGGRENGLSDRFRRLLAGLGEDLRLLDVRIKELDEELASIVHRRPAVQRLLSCEVSGPRLPRRWLPRSAPGSLCRGREFSVAMGLTPKQHGSGGKERLLGISKRGDAYLRKLLVHGARAQCAPPPAKPTP